MTAKKVFLDSRSNPFSTQGKAQEYYNQIAKNLHASDITLENGQDFDELKEIYIKYCQYTHYELDRLNQFAIIGFKGVQTIRENLGKHVTTICLAVIFSDNTTEEFSVKAAIKEIATKQN